MEKLNKIIFFCFIIISIVLVLNGCGGGGSTSSSLINIKGECKLSSTPATTNYSGVEILFSGAETTSLTTNANGIFNVNVAVGNYSIAMSKTGYLVVTKNVTTSTVGSVHDFGEIVLYPSTPPGSPY